MRRRWLWAALGLSLALNVLAAGYIVGALWPHGRHGPAALAKELDLTPTQRQAFERHIKTMRENNRRYREETRPLLRQSLSELAKPQPDEAVVDHLFDEGITKRRELQSENARSLRDFLGTLEPAQRQKFVEALQAHLERRRQPGRHPGSP